LTHRLVLPNLGLYDVIALLMSIVFPDGHPLEKVGDLLAGASLSPLARCLDTIGSNTARVCLT